MIKPISLFLFTGCLAGLLYLNNRANEIPELELERATLPYRTDKPGLELKIGNKTSIISALDLRDDTFPPFKQDHFQADIKGLLKVPSSGRYSLELASDDTALLYLNNSLVVENRGRHPLASKKKTVWLARGTHLLWVQYENLGGPAAVKLAWGKKGEPRHTVGPGEIFQAQNFPKKIFSKREIPPNEELQTGLAAEEWVGVNQGRALLLGGMLLSLLLFFGSARLATLARSWEVWAAVGIFLLALVLRFIYYAAHLHQRVHLIVDGGDNYYYLTLPLRWVTHGEFISINCGNLPILLPILGILYKYFNFFPGLHYYALGMITLGSVMALLPWLLLRSTRDGWAGLLAGLFLALHPSLVELKVAYVNSDILGFVAFSIPLFFCIKALRDERSSSYLWAGFTLPLMPLTRTVFIPLAPILAFGLLILGRNRRAAFFGLLLFISILLFYEALVYPVIQESYFWHFLREGFDATTVHRAPEAPPQWWDKILWLPHHAASFLKLMGEHLLPIEIPGKGFRWGMAALIFLAAIGVARLFPRIFLFLLALSGLYLYEISSYHLQERLTFPLVFVLALLLALGLPVFLKLKAKPIGVGMILPLFFMGTLLAATKAKEGWAQRREEKYFHSWVQKEAPPKSILVTDNLRDPWILQRETGLPVFFEITFPQTLVVTQQVIPVKGVTFLAQQSQLPKPPPNFNLHRYVVDGIASKGYRYLVLHKRVFELLQNNKKTASIQARQLAVYPGDPEKGIWELEWPQPAKPDSFPDNLDRFLIPFKKRAPT